MKQKRVFLMSGIPGSGKTTWIKKQIAENGGIHISRDKIRFSLLNEGDSYFQKEDEVFTKFCHQVQQAIDDDDILDVYVDATHLSNASRYKIIKHLNLHGAKCICVSFDLPVEICLKRNARRTGQELVPESTIQSMAKNFSIPSPGWMFQEVWNVNENGKVVVYT